ncbi:hypothetical protein GE061_016574 [Apolygus lucorum]|uniref:Uncharacterized protein n=1 Tax=Apolygus lucorum TaxID=248454 RepID=A0A6A4K227_APOLU|nr:hypothetical protein GE061_016574 [Apolygus lucorum]
MKYVPAKPTFPLADPIKEIILQKNLTTMKIKVEPEDSEAGKGVKKNAHEELPVLQFRKLTLNDEEAESEDDIASTEKKISNIKNESDDDEEIDPDKLVGKGLWESHKINTSRAQSGPYFRSPQHSLQQPNTPTTIINGRQMNGGSHIESGDFIPQDNEFIPLTVTEITETQLPFQPTIPAADLDDYLGDFTNDDIERLFNIPGLSLNEPNLCDVVCTNIPMLNYVEPASENLIEEDKQDHTSNEDPEDEDSAYGSVFGNSPQSSHSATEFSPRNENHFDQAYQYFDGELDTSSVPKNVYNGSTWSPEPSISTPPATTANMNILPSDVTSRMNIKALGSRKSQKENLPILTPSGPSNVKPSNNIIKSESLSARLISKMRPERKVAVWYSTIKEPDDKFLEKNGEDQTRLMKDLLLDPRVPGLVEAVYERIGRIKTSNLADLLSHRDVNGHCAMYQAATLHSDIPEIAAYIAESYAFLGCDVNKPYKDGNTILHYLAQLGDKFDRVLDELLKVTVKGERIFRVDQQNNAGNTPLHVAALHHMTSYAGSTFSIASTLIKHRSSVWLQNSEGATPLHVAAKSKACDPEYFRKLLEQRGAENIQDKDGNTPLHLVALAVSVPNFAKLKKVIQHLLTSKARLDFINNEGNRPLDNIHPKCKEEITREFLPKRQ